MIKLRASLLQALKALSLAAKFLFLFGYGCFLCLSTIVNDVKDTCSVSFVVSSQERRATIPEKSLFCFHFYGDRELIAVFL